MKIEQLNDEQRAMYDWIASMSAEKAQEYLATWPSPRESGASRKQKLTVLQTRYDAATRILQTVDDYRDRIGILVSRLQCEDVSAKEVDLRLHTLPKVEGVVLRLEGKPRRPKVPKDPEEERLKALAAESGEKRQRGRPRQRAEAGQENAVAV